MKIGDIEIPDRDVKCFSVKIDNNVYPLEYLGETHHFSPYRDIYYEITTYDNKVYTHSERLYNEDLKRHARIKKQ